MAICIAGFHRAGTSMVARLLARSGVYLGPEEDLLAPAPDNPEGFWENREFLSVNDELLERFGGAWDVVPALPDGWWERPELGDLRDRVRALVDRFDDHGVWGWKDPRNSLTLPFWRSLVPGLRVVVCVRSPFEIARSFTRRGYTSTRFSFDLWVEYTDRLLAAVELEDCVVTHYASYFHDPEQELKRVADALELHATESVLRNAREDAVVPSLRHHRVRLHDLTAALPPEVAARYERLCAASGPVFAASQRTEDGAPVAAPARGSAAAGAQDPLDAELALLRGSRTVRYAAGLRRLSAGLRAGADASSSP